MNSMIVEGASFLGARCDGVGCATRAQTCMNCIYSKVTEACIVYLTRLVCALNYLLAIAHFDPMLS